MPPTPSPPRATPWTPTTWPPVSPLIARTIRRFGDWHLDLTPPKDVIATRLELAPGALFPTAPV